MLGNQTDTRDDKRAAETENQRFTAGVVENPMRPPNVGKISAATTLKKKMTETDCATSSSRASITGAVAAIADPPQIEEPTPTRIDVFG